MTLPQKEYKEASSFLAVELSPTFLNGAQMRPLKNMENKIPSDKCGRVQLICVEVQAHISSEPPEYYNQD